jgi:pantoate kinase
MVTATAYAPGHLTGLFQICDHPKDPLMKGARGSWVSLDLGVQGESAANLNNVYYINLAFASPGDNTSGLNYIIVNLMPADRH